MSDAIDFAEGVFQRMIGRRVTLAFNDRVITGKVLPGVWRWHNDPSCRGFRLRAQATYYVPLSLAPSLRLPPIKHRTPRLLNRGRP